MQCDNCEPLKSSNQGESKCSPLELFTLKNAKDEDIVTDILEQELVEYKISTTYTIPTQVKILVRLNGSGCNLVDSNNKEMVVLFKDGERETKIIVFILALHFYTH